MTKYYVENWDTEEVIAEFDTYEQRQEWIKQEGYQYNDCFPTRKRAKQRADRYKKMGFDVKIIKASYMNEYRVYVKKEV